MKRLSRNFILLVAFYLLWQFTLALSLRLSTTFFPVLHTGFLGEVPWSNFDGVHYISIAKAGYHQFEQAFFPLYPMMLRSTALIFHASWDMSGRVVSVISFIVGLWIFYKLFSLENNARALWAVILLLSFPTSFYFNAVYTESTFFLFAVSSLYAARKRRWWLSGLCGALASMTKLFGIYLLIPVFFEYIRCERLSDWKKVIPIFLIPIGLASYMAYLWSTVGDPLFFFHAQSAFGANRSGSSFIFLPQVLWRYAKIIGTVSPAFFEYKIAVFELGGLLVSFFALYLGKLYNVNFSYLLYSFFLIVTPTLTGTLSSLPRYILSAFPLFYFLAHIPSVSIKTTIVFIFFLVFMYMSAAFFRGYFVG